MDTVAGAVMGVGADDRVVLMVSSGSRLSGVAAAVLVAAALLPVPLHAAPARADHAAAQADVSLGTLICSAVGPADAAADDDPDEPPAIAAEIAGPAYRVACSFHDDGGVEETYLGTIYLKQGDALPLKPLVWSVRGLNAFHAEAGVLARSYTLRAPRAEGAAAPLVPKDTEDTSLGLYPFGLLHRSRSEGATVTGIDLVLRASLA